MTEGQVTHVSDTAFWVATYRARETERPDALFRDPLAGKLAGARGAAIAKKITGAGHVEYSVIVRTVVIDGFIREAVARGVDTVLNLGAGLDTRPYRMELPPGLRWIEVDYPDMIAFKETHLAGEAPRCRLERRVADLADAGVRRALLKEVNATSGKVLVITEGVTPYLSDDQVGALADDLARMDHCVGWVTDYTSKEVMKFIRRSKIHRQLKSAPFKFDPPDWRAFYLSHGWKEQQMQYLVEVGEDLGRRPPAPWWVRLLALITPAEKLKPYRQMTGYALMVRA